MTKKLDYENLKLARQNKGWTQADACRHFDVSISTWVNWERGVVQPNPMIYPDIEKFIKENL